jgi:hypothetical protein
MSNIGMPGVTLEKESDNGFEISWQEPPMLGDCWRANVAGTTPHLLALMKQAGSKVIEGRDRADMIAKAKRYINDLLKR